MATLRTAALSVLFVGGLTFAPAARATFPGTNGSIVYTASAGGPPASRRIDSVYLGAEGSSVPDKANLPSTGVGLGGNSFDPSWSADGRSLAFASTRTGNSQIYAVQLDLSRRLTPYCGVEVCRLTTDSAEDYDPSWSPDGRHIVFTSTRDGSPQIYRMNASGGEVTRLTFDNATDQQATWSQSGAIAFASSRNGTPEIYVMNEDGGEVRQVTNQPGLTTDPSWSPDGRELAYANGAAVGSFQVFTIKLAGGSPRQLTTTLPDNKLPAWSPDGSKILITQGPALSPYTSLAVLDAKTGTLVDPYLASGGDGNWAPLPEPPSNVAPATNTTIARPVAGTVTVNPGQTSPLTPAPTSSSASPITRPVALPVEATYDTTHGEVELSVASGTASAPQLSSVAITGGLFAFGRHGRAALPTVRLLGHASGCSRGRRAIASRARQPHVRGHSKGRMQAEGGAGRAASKGTSWEVRNTCAGTLYRVFEDSLVVTDPRRAHPIRVTAGHHYLVRFLHR